MDQSWVLLQDLHEERTCANSKAELEAVTMTTMATRVEAGAARILRIILLVVIAIVVMTIGESGRDDCSDEGQEKAGCGHRTGSKWKRGASPKGATPPSLCPVEAGFARLTCA